VKYGVRPLNGLDMAVVPWGFNGCRCRSSFGYVES
jgi:hypothetical protein